ncbi:MAG: hypothetical protein JNM28_09705 [Armatimonadetes bacterium]|nr:hypothetical protein [Armatimonadota bacterium]
MTISLAMALALPAYGLQAYNQPLIPPAALPLGGYTERGDRLCEPGGQPLASHTLILSQGGKQVALVALEGLTVPESLYREVRRRAEMPVFLVATHTHCAPDTQMLNERMTLRIPGIAPFKREWLDWYSLKIAGGIAIAGQQAKLESELRFGQAKAGLARPRRQGTTVTNLLTVIQDDQGSAKLIVFGAHATCHGPDTVVADGDWPGRLMNMTGGLVFPGAIGNASPNIDGPDGDAKAGDFARLLSQIPTPDRTRLDGLGYWEEPIRLDPVKPHPDFAKDYKINDALAQIAVSKFAPQQANLSAVVLGELILLGVPGEPSGDLELQIQAAAKSRGYACAVVSHCNGWIGYILTPGDYDRGGYEATLSFHGRETGQRLFEASERLFARLPNRAKAGTASRR